MSEKHDRVSSCVDGVGVYARPVESRFTTDAQSSYDKDGGVSGNNLVLATCDVEHQQEAGDEKRSHLHQRVGLIILLHGLQLGRFAHVVPGAHTQDWRKNFASNRASARCSFLVVPSSSFFSGPALCPPVAPFFNGLSPCVRPHGCRPGLATPAAPPAANE